jgi:predicted phage tail protein
MNPVPVLLYGHLAERFGRRFDLAVGSPAEAIRALCMVVDGFREYLREHSEPGYRILVGGEAKGKDGLMDPIGSGAIKIVPVVAGAKNEVGQILGGVVLLVAAAYMPAGYGFLANMMAGIGASMVMGGVAQLLTNAPPYQPDTNTSAEPTYSFNGPQLTVGQGCPVPVLLGGPLRIGGALISMGASSGTWTPNGLGGAAPDEIGTRGGDGDVDPWVWAVKPA